MSLPFGLDEEDMIGARSNGSGVSIWIGSDGCKEVRVEVKVVDVMSKRPGRNVRCTSQLYARWMCGTLNSSRKLRMFGMVGSRGRRCPVKPDDGT